MKVKTRRYIQLSLALMAIIIIGGTMLANSPRVQRRISILIATELENHIGTRVNLGGVRWLFPNDIVIDSLAIDDQEGEQLISIGSVAAKVEWIPLIKNGKISIRNLRLFSPRIAVYKSTPEEEANYQFLIDAFASKKEKKATKLNLRINSLIIRHAYLKYDIHSENTTPGKFNPAHIAIDDLSAYLSLKTLTTDTLSAMVRHIELKEQSGLRVDDMYMRFVGNRQGATLANFCLEMPHSTLRLDTIWASYSISNEYFNINDILNSSTIKGRTLPSQITPADLSPLFPTLNKCDEKVFLVADVIGNSSRINVKELDIYTKHRDISLNAKGSIYLNESRNHNIDLNLHDATITNEGWEFIEEKLPYLHAMIPSEVVRIGHITAQGNLRSNSTQGNITLDIDSDAGTIQARANIDNKGYYTTHITGKDINIAKAIPTSPLTRTDIILQAEGTITDMQSLLSGKQGLTIPTGTFKGMATQTILMGYEYKNIQLNGAYSPHIYSGKITIDDPNGQLNLQARYDESQLQPQYTAQIVADSINLHALNLIDIHEGRSFSARLNGNIKGKQFNHMTGSIKIDSLTMHREGDDYSINSIALYSFESETKTLSLNSDFMNAAVKGDFTYQTIMRSLLAHLHDYLPSLCPSHNHRHITSSNQCLVDLQIKDTEPLKELLLIPISIDKTASIVAQFYDESRSVGLDIQIPQLTYNGNDLANVVLQCKTNGHKAEIQGQGSLYNDDTHIAATLQATAKEDKLSIGALWQSNPADFFTGAFSTDVFFARNFIGNLETTIQSDSSHTTINKSLWELHPFVAHIAPKHTTIKDFRFEHDATQYLNICGTIADTHSDTLNIKLNDIDLSYLLSLVKLQGISFGGNVSGDIKAADLYTQSPFIDANVKVHNFSFCEGPMGDAVAHAYWNQDSTRLQFNAKVNETANHTTLVDGYADLTSNRLWIDLFADSTNISFLNGLLSSFMGNVEGNANGHISIGGPMNAIDLDGKLLTDAAFDLTPTNARYHFKDTLYLSPGEIQFRGIEARDLRNQKAIVNGSVTHDKLKDFGYNLYIDAQNVLGIDLPNTGNDNFYTTIYGTGEVQVKGGPDMPLQIDIMAQPEAGSLFALNLASQDITSSDAFITFVDRTPKRNAPTSVQERRRRGRRQSTDATEPLIMNISTNITPDATLKLVMNQATDDNISVHGSGDLQVNINEDDINLFGTYTVSRGSYTLNLQDFITKKFDVIDGSTVTFDGDPMTARLNITASHTVNQAPLKDLNPEATDNVLVNCLLKIEGTLNKPTLSFNLELPQGTEEEKAILRSFTSTEEQTNLQFIYLLGLGKFYTMDIANANTAEGMANMESLLTSTISNQINNLLSNIIQSDNWNIASNIRTSNALAGDISTWENMEIGGMLEGRLLNNKLLINGNFSYRDNPMYASNFIGDFDVRYLLSNNLSVKGYNKTNDRYFTKTALTTQGIGLLFQHDFPGIFSKRKKKTRDIITSSPSDSTTLHHNAAASTIKE